MQINFVIHDQLNGNCTHSMSKTKTYETWHQMKKRCLNKNDKDYKNYGGRRITICKRWKKFENFYKDMREKPEGMTIDRIDNGKGYYPKNCRWATARDQARNKRTSIKLTFNGETLYLIEWARKLKIKYATLRQRYSDLNWDAEKTLTIDPEVYKKSHALS